MMIGDATKKVEVSDAEREKNQRWDDK